MKEHFFLGLAAGMKESWWRHLFVRGSWRDLVALEIFLQEKYGGEAMLCKNGRSALALALKAYFKKGDKIIVNGFTCYAVYEAVKAAGLVPVWADIDKNTLNFNASNIDAKCSSALLGHGVAPARLHGRSAPSFSAAASERPLEVPNEHFAAAHENGIRGIIVQNTLGNPVDMEAIEKLAEKYDLTIIEDLAHSAGVKYADGREAGTVGTAAVLSFGKDKSIDTISGGAVIYREPKRAGIKTPKKAPRISDTLRARFYPMFGAMCRGLSYVRLGGALMRGLVAIHWVEKSADNKLDLTRRPAKFEAKLALEQLRKLRKSGEPPLREFYLVHDREKVLEKLKEAGYYFDGLWYEKPVSPARYYKRVHFPERECPVAVEVSEKIVNIPRYYNKLELLEARKIIKEYLDEGEKERE